MSQLDSANLPATALDPGLSSEASPLAAGPGRAGPDAPVQKQGLNVYTMMLVVSFIAMTIASVMMYLELQKYGTYPWWDTSSARPQSVSSVDPHNTTFSHRLL